MSIGDWLAERLFAHRIQAITLARARGLADERYKETYRVFWELLSRRRVEIASKQPFEALQYLVDRVERKEHQLEVAYAQIEQLGLTDDQKNGFGRAVGPIKDPRED